MSDYEQLGVWDIDMDLLGLVVLPDEISEIRNRFAIKVCPKESEKPRIWQRKRPAQKSVKQVFSRSEGKRRHWSGVGLKSEDQGISTAS